MRIFIKKSIPLYSSNGKSTSEFIEPPGMGLGLDNSHKFDSVLSEQKIKLKKGDVLLFYTDGVTEARDSSQNEFNESRLKNLITQNSHLNATKIKEALVDEIQQFVGDSKHHDDLTFVVTKVR